MKTAMTRQTKNLDFVGIDLQFDPACLLFQIESKVRDSERKQADVIDIVQMFERSYQDRFK